MISKDLWTQKVQLTTRLDVRSLDWWSFVGNFLSTGVNCEEFSTLDQPELSLHEAVSKCAVFMEFCKRLLHNCMLEDSQLINHCASAGWSTNWKYAYNECVGFKEMLIGCVLLWHLANCRVTVGQHHCDPTFSPNRGAPPGKKLFSPQFFFPSRFCEGNCII